MLSRLLSYFRRPIVTITTEGNLWSWTSTNGKSNAGAAEPECNPYTVEARGCVDAIHTLGPCTLKVTHLYHVLDEQKRAGTVPYNFRMRRGSIKKLLAMMGNPKIKVLPPEPAPRTPLFHGHRTVVATDGSCNDTLGLAAWSWWVSPTCYGSGSCQGGSYTAELQAVKEALLANTGPLVILTDCQSLLSPLNNMKGGRKPSRSGRGVHAAQDAALLEEIYPLLQGRDVKFKWLKAHCTPDTPTRRLNREADLLARSTMRAAV